jgi:hypothetical protein
MPRADCHLPESAKSLPTSATLRMFSSRSSGAKPRFLFRPVLRSGVTVQVGSVVRQQCSNLVYYETIQFRAGLHIRQYCSDLTCFPTTWTVQICSVCRQHNSDLTKDKANFSDLFQDQTSPSVISNN